MFNIHYVFSGFEACNDYLVQILVNVVPVYVSRDNGLFNILSMYFPYVIVRGVYFVGNFRVSPVRMFYGGVDDGLLFLS